jgi:hypothetical protein
MAKSTHAPVQKPASLKVTSAAPAFLKIPRSTSMMAMTKIEKRRKNRDSLINI